MDEYALEILTNTGERMRMKRLEAENQRLQAEAAAMLSNIQLYCFNCPGEECSDCPIDAVEDTATASQPFLDRLKQQGAVIEETRKVMGNCTPATCAECGDLDGCIMKNLAYMLAELEAVSANETLGKRRPDGTVEPNWRELYENLKKQHLWMHGEIRSISALFDAWTETPTWGGPGSQFEEFSDAFSAFAEIVSGVR